MQGCGERWGTGPRGGAGRGEEKGGPRPGATSPRSLPGPPHRGRRRGLAGCLWGARPATPRGGVPRPAGIGAEIGSSRPSKGSWGPRGTSAKLLVHWVRKANAKSPVKQIRANSPPATMQPTVEGLLWPCVELGSLPSGPGAPRRRRTAAAVSLSPRASALSACPLVVSASHAPRAGEMLRSPENSTKRLGLRDDRNDAQ